MEIEIIFPFVGYLLRHAWNQWKLGICFELWRMERKLDFIFDLDNKPHLILLGFEFCAVFVFWEMEKILEFWNDVLEMPQKLRSKHLILVGNLFLMNLMVITEIWDAGYFYTFNMNICQSNIKHHCLKVVQTTPTSINVWRTTIHNFVTYIQETSVKGCRWVLGRVLWP